MAVDGRDKLLFVDERTLVLAGSSGILLLHSWIKGTGSGFPICMHVNIFGSFSVFVDSSLTL